ncbi:unnamed protein product [Periconia digitata]|uniref:Uncharacterized protein n=1 Tax=Periconia digitata TaxID=1303443 RepID=A0A9W4UP97_9PLEO|nr:unnamed protein product [Periconia digitata]
MSLYSIPLHLTGAPAAAGVPPPPRPLARMHGTMLAPKGQVFFSCGCCSCSHLIPPQDSAAAASQRAREGVRGRERA